jgi:hypothetical protein
MKRLTAEEAAQIQLKPPGRGSLIRTTLFSLKPGDYALVENKDWKSKTQTPVTYCRRLENGTKLKYECHRTADATGWLVKRIA